MNTPVFLVFTAFTAATAPAYGSSDPACPSGLPAELMVDCIVAQGAADSAENSTAYFGTETYNVSVQLQAWVDRQMQRDIARESSEPTDSDVAQQLDKH